MKSFIFGAACLVPALAFPIAADVVVDPPNFALELLATDLDASGSSMAVDRFGNVYLVDQDPLQVTPSSITQVTSSGVVNSAHASGFGLIGQLATNPIDGFVYLVESSPLLPVILSNVWRLDPGGGATQLFSVDVVASGFTIDNLSNFMFGGMGLAGPGLYRATPPFGPGIHTTTFQTAGFGSNAILQALMSNDILIASGDEVRRWIPGTLSPVDYFDFQKVFIPNQIVGVNSLARAPFNQLGAGAMIGIREFTTVCFCGAGLAYSAEPTGDLFSPTSELFLTELYANLEEGVRAMATGVRQDLYWYTNSGPSIGPGGGAGGPTLGDPSPNRLFRITQEPGVDSQGSLFAAATPATLTFDLFGPFPGGDPFLLSMRLSPSIFPPVWVPPFGYLDLVPGFPGTFLILDGVGVFGPFNPLAVIPGGGAFTAAFSLPGGLSGVTFDSQALILSSDAPNEFFFATNVESLLIP